MSETAVNDTPLMTDELFQLFAKFIYDFAGIRLSDQKKTLMVSRFQKRLRALGLSSYQEYYKRVKADEDETIIMLNCISTNTTKFFRENHHFEYLRDTLIPRLVESRCQQREIRIWSAGCSTGEEPYSIAVSVSEALRERFPNADPDDPFCGWDVKILASDISTNVLASAQRGIYSMEQLPDRLAPDFLRRHFLKGTEALTGAFAVKDFLKQVVRFRRLNLKDATYPFTKKFDLIFCRNVMIYFDDPMKNHVLNMFHRNLSDDGHLFLGHSETMFNNALFKPVGITVYRRL
ncbi:protein-glutamate O-methyltransferase CheR [Geobacter sp. SVR]|uniref:CheR family methyltransferase n=1 Tax=Geobacter sp. SVR TaxID=2495594 RepID=UPI00143EFF9B|nr:protein-glutamate O-methyltransferase CheR [Geobacter sp. SVR]BCS52679.1 SAM-dependent methyltransferase [Geobacter sp. SVR]GCF86826.1 SAM-dependent methyltransferase [Geobacter sp. SVR]